MLEPRTRRIDPRTAELVRPDTRAVGTTAELVASAFLLQHGYFVVERNFRTKGGEIDIVAYRAHPRFAFARGHDTKRRAHPLARFSRMLCFVEVRSRADEEHGGAMLAIGYRKRKQVARVAQHYLNMRDPDYDEIRFDVVAVTGSDRILVEDAFRAER
jgi:putative endonuclease